MSTKSITQAVSNVVEQLTDFSSEERRRIVQASLTLLGDAATTLDEKNDAGKDSDEFSAKARAWMRQYELAPELIGQVFHPDENGMEIIATIPGATRREQVRNAYVLSGIAQLLSKGETRFDDKVARLRCERGGFLDRTNHMKYMKGSEFTGSKEKGWILTTPGLKQGALLVAQMSKG